jgi:hypothetical protein
LSSLYEIDFSNLRWCEEEAVFRCPNCQKLFIGLFNKDYGIGTYYLVGSLPWTPFDRSFPLIEKISARFSEIFNQAAAAETYGLSDISGSGYRKALEFLIKDYSIALSPENAEAIRKKFLKNVIDDHVNDGRLKTAATLTTWLGNDEGHYERRWVDKDLSDLKALLELTISFVNEDVQLEQYVQSMRPDNPKRLTFLTSSERKN